MKLIDGKKVATDIRQNLKKKIDLFTERKPTLAFILIGKDPASQTYVKMKTKHCLEVGMKSKTILLPKMVSTQELVTEIKRLNEDSEIDGILVQQPFPKHIPIAAIVEAVNPAKDVDGFHPLNLGKLLMGEKDGFVPCTPLGVVKLLQETQICVDGKEVLIIGRSNIVGKPLAAILMQNTKYGNATVTVAHSHTKQIATLCCRADILIAAIGKPAFITKEMIKPGAVVIDVGINRIVDKKGKSRLVGDVDFDHIQSICSAITPVPGGVGPMTIAMLLANTLKSYEQSCAMPVTSFFS